MGLHGAVSAQRSHGNAIVVGARSHALQLRQG
jgi:hypothetical protein